MLRSTQFVRETLSVSSVADAADFFDALQATDPGGAPGVLLPQYQGSGTPTLGYVLTSTGPGTPPSWQAGGSGGSGGWYSLGPVSIAQNEAVSLAIGAATHPVLVTGVSEQVTAATGLTQIYTYRSSTSAQYVELSPSNTEFHNTHLRLQQTLTSSPIILLHFNNEAGTTTFNDACGRTVTRNGTPTLGTFPAGYYGNACASFPGNPSYLAISSHADFAYGASDLTIQMRIYMSSAPSERKYILLQGTTSVRFALTVGHSDPTNWGSSGSTLGLHVNYDEVSWGLQLAGTSALADSTWHHVAVTRSGSTWKIYVDGVQQSSATYSYSLPQDAINIGGHSLSGGTRCLVGYLDQVAINTSLIYSGNFTPPTDQLNYVSYPYGSYYAVKPATGYYLSLSQVSLVSSLAFQQDELTLTGLRWLYTVDGGTTWKNHSGSTVDPADIGTSGSTAAQMSTLFTSWSPPVGGTELGLMVGLYAENFTLTPQVRTATFTYNGPISWRQYTDGASYQIRTYVSSTDGAVQVTRLASGSATIYAWAQNGN